MIHAAAARFARLPTGAKLLLILTAVLLPIGIALTWIGEAGIQQANDALRGRSEDQSRTAARSIESLIARNALGLRVAAAGALRDRRADPCSDAAQALTTAPAISRNFSLRDSDGELLCVSGGFEPNYPLPLVAPGDIRVWVDRSGSAIDLRVGVIGGMATSSLSAEDIRAAMLDSGSDIRSLSLRDRRTELRVIEPDPAPSEPLTYNEWPIANGALTARIGSSEARITTVDRLLLLLPVVMWVLAAFITWLLVSRLLIRPLKQLQRAVIRYQPGEELNLPRKLGPSTEIQELRDSFARAVARVEESEREIIGALEGQRRLVREVHHRVKNNLQVVASLLSIHGRTADSREGKAAFAAIGRRVDALSVVHRNHYAELEDNHGIALHALLSELGQGLGASAGDAERALPIEIDVDPVSTTQDVAVAIAFLVTEIVEFAMLQGSTGTVEISLRRTSPLTGKLTIASPALLAAEGDGEAPVSTARRQFERIIEGLARQLRSPLDRKLGRYSVDLPLFPER
jgi:two-component sensor histidine kinase